MKLKTFGFFDEMPEDEARHLLRGLQEEVPSPDEQRIIAYLRGGVPMLAIPGLVFNLLADKEEPIGPPHVFTDGEWAWTADVTFYIERYHINVPHDFAERMQQQRWQCPPVANMEALELEGWHT